MASKTGVALVTKDSATERAVASVFEDSERLETGGVYQSLQDLVARLELRSAPAVLVDIDPQPATMLKKLDEIITQCEGVRFVVLAKDLREGLLLEAMQAGARYFLLKKSIPSDLADVLQRLLRDGVEREGTLITVLSVSGGCGATTLSVNLANEIKLATGRSALLIDFDTSYGAVAVYLGLKGKYGLTDVLSSRVPIDSNLVRTTALAHSERFDVLLSPASIDFSRPAAVEQDQLEEVLKACKCTYDYTIVDAPRVSMELAATLATASKLSLIVFQLTIKDIQLLQATLAALSERGVRQERILVLANRFRKRGQMITIEEAKKVLGDVPLGTISNDFRSAVLGINYGKPLAQVAPRSALRRDVEQLAVQVSDLHSNHNT